VKPGNLTLEPPERQNVLDKQSGREIDVWRGMARILKYGLGASETILHEFSYTF